MAKPRDVGEKPGVGEAVLAGGSARGRPGDRAGGDTETNGVSRGGRDGGEDSFVIRAKFKIFFCKLNFSPFSWPQMKNL